MVKYNIGKNPNTGEIMKIGIKSAIVILTTLIFSLLVFAVKCDCPYQVCDAPTGLCLYGTALISILGVIFSIMLIKHIWTKDNKVTK